MYDFVAGLDLGAAVQDLWNWAWARHANRLSWYIRPLFLVPLAVAAYRRSGLGIVCTVVAMLSSMFWFPAPDLPDAQVRSFLQFEQDWLLGCWSVGKAAISSLVPLSLTAYCLALWRRSLPWGLGLLGAIAMGKLLWGAASGDGAGTMIVPALVGLLVGAVAIGVLLRGRQRFEVAAPSGPASTTKGH